MTLLKTTFPVHFYTIYSGSPFITYKKKLSWRKRRTKLQFGWTPIHSGQTKNKPRSDLSGSDRMSDGFLSTSDNLMNGSDNVRD
jgi:hypothetical protein